MSEALARDFGSVQRWRTEFFRDGLRARRWLGLGAAVLDAARRPAHQPVRHRAQPGDRERHTDARARHVRARLPHRLRRERDGLRRHVPAQRRLAGGRGPLRGREQGRAAAAAGAGGVRRRAGRRRRGGEGDAGAKASRVQLIDTRPKHSVSRQQDIADGVTWRDPERVGEWMGELSKEKPVVVYCAYGFHVGCRTAIALRDAGFDATLHDGGHSGWKAIGGADPRQPLILGGTFRNMTSSARS